MKSKGVQIVVFSPPAGLDERMAYYRGMVRRYVDAFNADDVEGVLACYADDAVMEDPVGNPERRFVGKDALRALYSKNVLYATLEIVGPIRGTWSNMVFTPILARIPDHEIDVITQTIFNDQGLVCQYNGYFSPSDIRKVTS